MDKPAKLPAKLNHNKFMDTPGQKYSAKRQCEILLRDKDAVMSPNQQISEICYNLQCKTPHRSGYYHAGPALEGTECGRGRVRSKYNKQSVYKLILVILVVSRG